MVEDAERLGTIWTRLKETSRFDARRAEVAAFNAQHDDVKRGLAITPVKFGISFTATFFNQAGALVLIYRDGSVQVNHGGTEMGQGLFTKIRQIAADALGVTPDRVRVMPTRTDKVPNTSATAASAGTDLNGAAVVDACAQIKARLAAVAASLPGGDAVVVRGTCARPRTCSACRSSRRATTARRASISIRQTGRGKPFHYFAFGAAVSEVEVDGFTGAYRLLRTDILAGRRRLDLAGDRSRADRRRLHPGRRAGSRSRSCSGTGGPARHGRRVHLQAAVVVRGAGRVQGRASSSARRSRASCSAARPSASRR